MNFGFFNPFESSNGGSGGGTIDLSEYAKKEDLVGQKTNQGGEIFNDYENNIATTNSHAEGYNTKANGNCSHAEGNGTTASSNCAHAEGCGTTASGDCSHAEGAYTTASAPLSHAEGSGTKASSSYQHVQGKFNVEDANGKYAFIIGNGDSNSNRSNALAIDWNGLIYINNNEDGYDLSTFLTIEDGVGQKTAEGGEIFNDYTNNIATTNSHAEGYCTKASGNQSHAEGAGTTASALQSHAEGGGTTASGDQSHAEGNGAKASGNGSHAEGIGTTASGQYSHAEGLLTKASSDYQHVQGKFNVEDSESKYAFIIGNGDGDSNRSNAFAIDWNGLIYLNNSDVGIDLSNLQTKEEITQARVDANGTSYATLKERLDSTDENVEKIEYVSNELKDDLDNSLGYNYYKIEPIWTNGAFYNRFDTLISDTHASYIEIEVKAGEKYHIVGYNAYQLSLYSLRDSDKKNVTTYPDASDKNYEKRKFDEYITIPEGVKYLCVSKWDSFGEMLVEKESYTRVSDIDTRVSDIDTVTTDNITDFYQIGNDTIEVGWVYTDKRVADTGETSTARHLTINNIIGGDTYRYTSIGGGDCHAVLWFDDTDNLISYVPFTNTWKQETVEVIAPTDAVKAIVNNINTSKGELVFEYFGLIRVVKTNPIIKKKVSDLDTRVTELEDGTIDFFEYENIKKRVIENQMKNDFAWSDFDGLYATITFDDTNADIDQLQNLAEELGVPFCYATIPTRLSNQMSLGTETALQTLQRAVYNGGEVLSHWSHLNAYSTDDDYYNCYIGSKKTLEEAGFDVRGVIVAGGGAEGTPESFKAQDWEKTQSICRVYYQYGDLIANNFNGQDSRYIEQFYNNRTFTDSGIDVMKSKIDAMVSQGSGWLNMASHGTNHSNTPSIDAFREIFQYAIDNGFTFVTWGEMYDKFKSSKLEERIKALELN